MIDSLFLNALDILLQFLECLHFLNQCIDQVVLVYMQMVKQREGYCFCLFQIMKKPFFFNLVH